MDYQVKAVQGRTMVLLNVTATHEEAAMAQVKAKGYTPIAAKALSQPFFKGKNKPFPLSLFSQELLALLEAGLNLARVLGRLSKGVRQCQSEHEITKRI